jgi:hypothetical protein
MDGCKLAADERPRRGWQSTTASTLSCQRKVKLAGRQERLLTKHLRSAEAKEIYTKKGRIKIEARIPQGVEHLDLLPSIEVGHPNLKRQWFNACYEQIRTSVIMNLIISTLRKSRVSNTVEPHRAPFASFTARDKKGDTGRVLASIDFSNSSCHS